MKKQIDILLVDDNITEQDSFSFALNELNIDYLCRYAKNNEDAIKLLSTLLPDFIFVYMPEKKEPDCFEQIRRIKAVANTPLFMFSTNINDSINKKALQCGVTECLRKTSKVSELILILKRIL